MSRPRPPSFAERLAADGTPLRRDRLDTVQVNVGKVCNQTCRHCHVDASPFRTEAMDGATADAVLAFLAASGATTLDITGGAPELNPHFRRLVTGARGLGAEVVDRCNLTILLAPGQDGLAPFLAEHRVRIVASLPCHGRDNVDAQRGAGVFDASIRSLRLLNDLGYGQPGSPLGLDLVYNPGGAFLPPDQARLEVDYQTRLADAHGVVFHRLLTITNMPIARFAGDLRRRGALEAYQALLAQAHRPANVDGLMCRRQVSIGWDGRLYDCDFNQMLDLALPGDIRTATVHDLVDRDVIVDDHCFGCTAGAGSSCGGAIG